MVHRVCGQSFQCAAAAEESVAAALRLERREFRLDPVVRTVRQKGHECTAFEVQRTLVVDEER